MKVYQVVDCAGSVVTFEIDGMPVDGFEKKIDAKKFRDQEIAKKNVGFFVVRGEDHPRGKSERCHREFMKKETRDNELVRVS